MNKCYAKKIKIIAILSIIFVLVLPISRNYGYKAYISEDGPDLSSSGTTWKSTCESRQTSFSQINPSTGTNFKISDFTINEDYGWYEWTYNNTTFVVVGAATLEGLEDAPSTDYSFVEKKDNIHYFHYGTAQNDWKFSTFDFKVGDDEDAKKCVAIVIDTYIQALDPSNKGWNGYEIDGEKYKAKKNNTQWIKFYVSDDYKDKYEKLENATLQLSSDGIFSSSSGTTKTEKKKNGFQKGVKDFCINAGDGIQFMLNIFGNKKFTYTKADIVADSSLNGEIHVEDSSSVEDEKEDNSKYNTIRTVNVSKTVENRKGQTTVAYTKQTEIPVISSEIYSACVGYVDFFDVNFFNTNTANSNGFWKALRDFIATAKNVVIYIVAALIIVLIIWTAIVYIFATIGDNPELGKRSKTIINNVVKAAIIMGSVYFFMIIIMYFYNEVLKLLTNGNNSIYLIRVNVDEVYSFNTNLIGLFRFRASSADLDEASSYAFWYMIYSIFTVFGYYHMFRRMAEIAFLTLSAPVTALQEMSGNVNGKGRINIYNVRTFFSTYIKLLFAPLIVVFLCRVAIIFCI